MKIATIHNLIRLELNKINSNLYDDFLDEEIDVFFNQEQSKYISTRYDNKGNSKKEGFEQSNKRKEDLSNLLIEDYVDTAYLSNFPNKYLFAVPNNYMYYGNSSLKIYGATSYTTSLVSTTNTLSSIIATIPFNAGSQVNLSNFRLQTSGSSNIIDTSTLTNSPSLYLYPDNYLNFIYAILKLTPITGYSIYWENYGGVYYPNQLIVVKANSGVLSIKYSWDNSTFIVPTFSTVTNTYLTGTSGGSYSYPAGIETQQMYIKELLSETTERPTAEEPLITRSGRYISVYCYNDFIVEKLYLTYIRQPNQVSLGLQVDCELADHCVYEIIAQLVAHLNEVIQSSPQEYQAAQNESNKSE